MVKSVQNNAYRKTVFNIEYGRKKVQHFVCVLSSASSAGKSSLNICRKPLQQETFLSF
jgi:hypothetical protein